MAAEGLRNQLRLWRTGEGLTLQELADLSGLSVSMISRIETGQRQPSPRVKVLIARRLGVRVRDLFDVEPIDDLEVEAEEIAPSLRWTTAKVER